MTHTDIPDYERFTHYAHSIRHDVYASNTSGPAIIIMHELPGLNADTLSLSNWFAERDYRVYLPLLFGNPMQSATIRNVLSICIRREIYLLKRGKSSPVTHWLRSLCQRVSKFSTSSGVGVIGMCISGGFVIPMMIDPSVRSVVAAQPALPLFSKSDPGVEADVLRLAAVCSATTPLLSLRFQNDWQSPRERQFAFKSAFSGQTVQQIADVGCGSKSPTASFESYEIPGDGHSTLTAHYRYALEHSCDTRKRVLQMFDRDLKKI